MNKLYALWLALTVFVSATHIEVKAQTNDINLIVSPTLGYTWWSKHANLGSTAFWGTRVGWSFGQNIEICGTYERTFDLQGKLREGNWNVLNNIADKMDGSKAKMDRWGGEVKINFLPNTLFTPYMLGGAGAMSIKHDAFQMGDSDYREEQLFGVWGLGAKFNLTQRVTLGLEARNTFFNLDEDSHYRNTESPNEKTLQNWSLSATFNVYLGGANRSKSHLEEALNAKYGGGLKGLVWVVDPGMAYINFSHNSRFHDQWFLGTAAGVDFSPVLGARAFYYTSTQTPAKFSLKLGDKIQLYGANFIGRLNYLRGLTPYLSLGGGYMRVSDNYVDRDGTHNAENGWFALAGAGLEMPIHRYFSLFANMNAMLCENENPGLDQAYRPSQVRANMMYQLGLRFRLGKSAQNAQQLYTDYAQSEVARLRVRDLEEQKAFREADRKKTAQLLRFYDDRIAQLDSQLVVAMQADDSLNTLRLQEERALLSDSKSKMLLILDPDVRQAVEAAADSLASDSLGRKSAMQTKKRNTVVLTAAQLNAIIDRVVNDSEPSTAASSSTPVTLSDLDKILLFALVNNGHSLVPHTPTSTAVSDRVNQGAAAFGIAPEELEVLRKRIEQLEKEVLKTKRSAKNR